MNLEECYKTV